MNARTAGGFEAEVMAVAEKLVPMTVALWNKVQSKLLPTPAKFHYLFNMRELSKVKVKSSQAEMHSAQPARPARVLLVCIAEKVTQCARSGLRRCFKGCCSPLKIA